MPSQPRLTPDIWKQYQCGPVTLSGDDTAFFERHLVFDHVVDPRRATDRQRYEALAGSIRDVLTQRWIQTDQTYERENPKRVYYLSMEFLIGRSLTSNVCNMGIEPLVREALTRKGLDLSDLAEMEPDAGLGNGGLGRLAACFIDSMATLALPAIGYGLRYEYGIFRQEIRNGFQVEHPDHWLRRPDPWEVQRPDDAVETRINCSIEARGDNIEVVHNQPSSILGIPYDRPVVGYGGRTINTLRLWGASTPNFFDFGEFSSGDFFGAVMEKVAVESLTRVLYPDDSTPRGRSLRFLQEYFLVSCSLADIIRRFRQANSDWLALPEKVAIQLNDTHPAMAVVELMRILVDEAYLDWNVAWDLTRRTLAYTNHTLLPEALERWPVRLFELLLPRHLDLLYRINAEFLNDVRQRFPGDEDRVRRMSLIEEGPQRKVRMAHLAIVGSHSTNGVAKIHSRLLCERTICDFAGLFPERFNNKTNGVTPRRWLWQANRDLSRLITEAIGDDWVGDLDQLRRLAPLADDAGFRDRFRHAKRAAKVRLAQWLRRTLGLAIDPDTIFDCQIKRIHEYKRQFLNALQILVFYNRLRDQPDFEFTPRTYLFAGKAAPAYTLAKQIIKLINTISETVNNDPVARGRLAVHFLPEYNVSLSERLIPATDVSEQISTAGYEASGTSNMKFMMNGALTVGTRDGATIEIAEEVGEENLFLFGLNAEQIVHTRGWYDPYWHYHNEPETRRALDLLLEAEFVGSDPSIFYGLRDSLLIRGDYYMHLADLGAYVHTQGLVGELYRQPEEWSRRAIRNVAASGKFSSDRTIREYANAIWNAVPCPVP
jgi:starch phosphorylase